MKHPDVLTLLAPLAGWSTPLDEAPDEVFAARLLGDGVAIDPTAGTLHAPCDGEIVLLPASRHAVTLRSDSGCEILVHVGIDTVALAGEGFEAHVRQGVRVRAGDVLLSFDLDFLARRAKSVLTPIIVTADSGCDIRRRSLDRPVEVGEWLMEIAPPPAAAVSTAGAAQAGSASRRLTVLFEHGIHARPAALLAASLRTLAADVRLLAHGREANARSTVALMGLGVQHGEEIEIRATGPDAQHAVTALAAAFAAHGGARPASPGSALARTTVPVLAMAPAEPSAERAQTAAPAAAGSLNGVVASAGLAVGPALQLRRPEIRVREQGAGVAEENAALDRARAEVRARLERRAHAAPSGGGGGDAASEIAAAHLELLDDPELLAAARAAIEAGGSAGFAWRGAVRAGAATLESLADARLRERADDLLDLESQVLMALEGSATGALTGIGSAAHAILIAR